MNVSYRIRTHWCNRDCHSEYRQIKRTLDKSEYWVSKGSSAITCRHLKITMLAETKLCVLYHILFYFPFCEPTLGTPWQRD